MIRFGDHDYQVRELNAREYLEIEKIIRRAKDLDEDEPLESALTRMRLGNVSALPVVRNGSLVGLLTLENVGELIMVNTALQATAGRSPVVDLLSTD